MKIYNLKKTFKNFTLSIDNMEIDYGKIYGIIGPNGSGKSTLIKLISGILEKDSGEIDYGGLKAKDITMIGRRPYMMNDSIYKNLIYPLRIRNIKPDENKINEYLDLAGFTNMKDQYAPSLSGGEMQKLALLRGMIFSPKLILIDEGFSNLDIESTGIFEEKIIEKQKKDRSTLIIVSHQISHISKLCDYIYFMWDGELVLEGDKDTILYATDHPKLDKYLQSVSL